MEFRRDREGADHGGRDRRGRRPLDFYDGTGALRDMVQSHLLQLLCLVAMEPPAGFTPSAVRNEKVKALWSLRPSREPVATHTVTGQYAATMRGRGRARLPAGSRARKSSATETFVALRAGIDNWRWAGVPFYLRTGKRLKERSSEILIQFRNAPYNIFAADEPNLQANQLIIHLQPEESVTLEIEQTAGTGRRAPARSPARAVVAQGRKRRPHAHC